MPIIGLNHITLVVADLPRSVAFYRDHLGAILRADWTKGAYLELGPLWVCLELGTPQPNGDDSHIALTCPPEEFDEMTSVLRRNSREWKENSSEGKSIYFLDPDGHKLELHIGSLETRLAHYRAQLEKSVTFHD